LLLGTGSALVLSYPLIAGVIFLKLSHF